MVMRTDGFIFDLAFICFARLLGVSGALQCFWPSKMRALRDQIGPKCNKERPLGQFLDRAHFKESGVFSRIGGLVLFLGAVLALVSFFGHLTLSR